MSDSTPAVFLSYAREDTAAAQRLAEALRAAGVEVWFDQSELRGGDAWDAKIRQQIKECALFMPVISANTQSRPEGYFRLEWRLADQRTHLMGKSKAFLVPVCIDATRDGDADVPDSFLAVQWTRLANGEANNAFCARVKTLLNPSPIETGRPRSVKRDEGVASPTPASPMRTKRKYPPWLTALVIAVPLVVGLVLAWRILPRPSGEPAKSVAAASLAPPAAAQQTEGQKLVAKARTIFQDGDDANRENFFLAEELLKRAVALDVSDAEAWAVYGQLSADMFRYGFDRTPARIEAMRTQVERATKLDPNSIEAQVAQASAADYLGIDQVVTETQMRALVQRAPNNRHALQAFGRKLGRAGKVDESVAVLDRAAQLAPDNPSPWADASAYLLGAARYAEAEAVVEQSIARRPSGRALGWEMILILCYRGDTAAANAALARWPAWNLIEDRGASLAGLAALWSRDPAKALAIYQRMPRDYLRDTMFTGPRAALAAFAHEQAGHREAAHADWQLTLQGAERELASNPGDPNALFWKAWALNQLGDRPAAEAIRQQLEQRNWEPSSYYSPEGKMAGLALVLGHPDQAIALLEQALAPSAKSTVLFKNSTVNYPLTRAILELNPLFDPLRQDERFKRLVAKPRETLPGLAAAGPVKADDKSIAVLAFANFGGDKENEYFSDGITEELLNVLAKVPGLRVAARTSAFYFKDKNVAIPEIAQKLNVAYVVEGSVQKSGTRVKITAQLIKASDGFHVWSDTFTRELKDVFAMQDEIAGLIAKQLQLTLGAAPRVAKTVNPEAHRLVLEGRFFWNQRNDVAFERAEAAYQHALELDPEFAEAHAGLADVWAIRGWYRIMVGNAVQAAADFARAKDEVRRAQTLNPTLAEPSATLGVVLMNELKFDESERQFAQAIALNPNYAVARHWHSCLLDAVGRLDESLMEIEQSVSLDPLSPNALWQKAVSFGTAGRGREALDATERALALRPVHPTVLSVRALNLWNLGRRDEAIAAARTVGRDLTVQPRWFADSNAIYVLRQAGQQAEAEGYAERALANVPKDDYRYGTTLVALGRGKEALTFMRALPATALENVFWHPMWDPLREDAQFQPWLVKLGCAEHYKFARDTQARMLKEQAAKK